MPKKDPETPESASDLEQSNAAIDRLAKLAADTEISSKHLVADVRDYMLDQFKHAPKPWHKMSENEQADMAANYEDSASGLVQKIIEHVRANGQEPIRAILDSYGEKAGIEAKIKIKTFDDTEAIAAVTSLHKARGKLVLITIADTSDIQGEDREPEVMPDAPEMAFDAGDDSDIKAGDGGAALAGGEKSADDIEWDKANPNPNWPTVTAPDGNEYNYVGAREPKDPELGQSWFHKATEITRYWYGEPEGWQQKPPGFEAAATGTSLN